MTGLRRDRRGAPLAGGTAGRGLAGPLTLIHTNNCSNPISMRLPEGLGTHDRGLLMVWLDGYSRGAADAKSTRR